MTSIKQARNRLGRALMSCLCVLFLVTMASGCTNSDTDTTDPTAYVEPAWMVEERRTQEEIGRKLVACFAEAGINGTLQADYGISIDDPPGLTDEQRTIRSQEIFDCTRRIVGEFEPSTPELARLTYERALDTRACFEYNGYTVSDPPSEDAYVDAYMDPESELWGPYQDLIDQIHSGRLQMAEQEYYDLTAACPQYGTSIGMSW